MRPELVFFYCLLSIWTHKICSFLSRNLSLIHYFYQSILICRKITLKVNKNPVVHTKLQSWVTPRKKNENQKNLFNFEFYARPAFY